MVGVVWSCSEQDTMPPGKAAIGYSCASMINPGTIIKFFRIL
jgi:hypothetical protein